MTPAHSIKRRMAGMILIPSLVVLFLTAAFLFSYEIHSYKAATRRTLATLADVIAGNSSAALIYDDRKLAAEILSALRVEPEITNAALFDSRNELFVTLPSAPADPPRPPIAIAPRDGLRFDGGFVIQQTQVTQGPSRVGTLVIVQSLQGMYRRLGVYALVLLGVLGVSAVVAAFLSQVFQRRISAPILALAGVARTVSGEKNYTVRAPKLSDDELGALTDAFNGMLDEIQASHSALSRNEAQMRLVTDNSSIFLAHLDREHRYKFVNFPYAQRYGRTPDQVIGRHVAEIVGQETYEAARPHIEATLAGNRVEFELPVVYGDRRGWGHLVYVPERAPDGEIVGLVAVVTDITARKRIEQDIERARDEAVAAARAKDDFVAALSHELRTPLNPVLLVASEAAANPALPADVRADFALIRKNVELEARLIDDLLDLTRITRGKLALEHTAVDMNAALQDTLTILRADLERKKVSLAITLRATDATVLGDAVRLRQVLWNILNNAAKFTPEGGRITIESDTQSAPPMLAIRVSDNGIGMTPSELSRIFDAFSQGDHAAGGGSHRFGGLGLGLAISRMLVDLHGGQIRAHSAGPGQGASFFIQLPLWRGAPADQEAPPVRSVPSTPPFASGGRLLLVDDHGPTRSTLAQMLGRRGFEVSAAGTVAEARELARDRSFDLVLSDIGLPDGDGCSLMTELRERQPGLPGIALSGYGMDDDIARTRLAGFAAHLTKPINIAVLERTIARVLGRREPDRASRPPAA